MEQREEGPATAYLMLLSSKSPRFGEVRKALPNVPEYAPILVVGDNFYDARDMAFCQLDYTVYWADNKLLKAPANYGPTKVWFDQVEFGTYHEGRSVGKYVVGLYLVIPGPTGEFPADLAPAVPAVLDWRRAQCSAAIDMLDGVEVSTTTVWAKHNSSLAAAVPPAFRMPALIEGKGIPSKSTGRLYTVANAKCSPTTLPQLTAIDKFSQSEEGEAAMKRAEGLYNAKLAKLDALAKPETPA